MSVSFDPALAFRALGDPTRFATARLLARRERTPSELAALLAVSRPTMTHHLSLLREAGLLEEREGSGHARFSLRMDRVKNLPVLAFGKESGAHRGRGTSLAAFPSPVGVLEIESSDAGLLRVEKRSVASARSAGERREAGGSARAQGHLEAAFRWFDRYFRGAGARVSPRDLSFQWPKEGFAREVWKELLRIPRGELRTYGEIAARVGKPGAARAVGRIVGRNPFGILVPCHRVIGAQGAITGYAWGLPMKEWLLRHEGWSIEGKKVFQ